MYAGFQGKYFSRVVVRRDGGDRERFVAKGFVFFEQVFKFPSHFHFVLRKSFRHEKGYGNVFIDFFNHIFAHGAQRVFLVAREVYSGKNEIGDNIYRYQ